MSLYCLTTPPPVTMHKNYTLDYIEQFTGATLVGDKNYKISGVSDLESATEDDISFFHNPLYTKKAEQSQAGALIVPDSFSRKEGQNYLVHSDPNTIFQKVIELFAKDKIIKSGFSGIHETAVIHPTARIGKNVQIGPHVVIDQEACIGDNTRIGASCSIGPKTTIGTSCEIHPLVMIREACEIGNNCIIQSGSVIGSCGFGYATDKTGTHTKLKQLGNVVIEDNVDIGANCTIDRARFKSTRIGKGTKIDNLVQMGHGATIGKNCLIVSQVGISGSTEVGNYVVLGGQVGLVGHIKVADFVQVGAQAGVSKSLLKPGGYIGSPASEIKTFQRREAYLRKIEKYVERIKAIEAQLEDKKQSS